MKKQLMMLGRIEDEVGDLKWIGKGGKQDETDVALVKAQEAREDERNKNDEANKVARGEYITFGTVIQLRHVTSGRYLTCQKGRAHFSPKMIGVALVEHGDEGSWFRVGLGYRAQTEGDKVRCDDDITLESVKSTARFIHVDRPITSDDVVKDQSKAPWIRDAVEDFEEIKTCCEVNLSRNKSRLHVILWRDYTVHYRMPQPGVKDPSEMIRGGDVVMLSHKEQGGSVAYNQGQYPGYPVIDCGHDERSNTLWRIEACDMRHGGQLVHIGDFLYRLHHLGTGTYLTCGSNFQQDHTNTLGGTVGQRGGIVRNTCGMDITLPSTWNGDNQLMDVSLKMTHDYTREGSTWNFKHYQRDAGNYLSVSMFFYLSNPRIMSASGKIVSGYLDAGTLVNETKKELHSVSSHIRMSKKHDVNEIFENNDDSDNEDLEEDDGDVFRLLYAETKHKEDVLSCILVDSTECDTLTKIVGQVTGIVDFLEDISSFKNTFHLKSNLQTLPPISPSRGRNHSKEQLFDDDSETREATSDEYKELSELLKVVQRHQQLVCEILNLWDETLGQDDATKENEVHVFQSTLGEQDVVGVLLNLITAPFRPSEDPTQDTESVNENGELRYPDAKTHPLNRRNIMLSEQFAPLKRICVLAHNTLRFLCKDHRANQMALFMKLDAVRSQVGLGVGAVYTMIYLFRDNATLLNKIKRHQVKTFGEMIEKKKRPRHVMFLHVICRCAKTTMVKNQNYIIKEILKGTNFLYEVMTPAENVFHETLAVRNANPKAKNPEWVDFNDLPKGFPEDKLAYDQVTEEQQVCYLYHLECINLLAKVSENRNREALDHLMEKVDDDNVHSHLPDYATMLRILFDLENLPYSMRAAYAKLMHAVFVDREPYFKQDFVQLTRVSSVSGEEPARTGVKPTEDIWDGYENYRPDKEFKDLRDLLEREFKDRHVEIYNVDHNNPINQQECSFTRYKFLKSLLKLQLQIVQFGVYGGRVIKSFAQGFNPTTKDLANEEYDYESLHRLIDVIGPILENSDMTLEKICDVTVQNFECKMVVCDILDVIYDMKLDDHLDRVVNTAEKFFKEGEKRAKASGTSGSVQFAEISSEQMKTLVNSLFVKHAGGAIDYEDQNHPGLCQSEAQVMQHQKALLGLVATNYRPIQTKALSLIYRQCMEKSNLVTVMGDLQLLVRSQLVTGYQRCTEATAIIRSEIKWLQSNNKARYLQAVNNMEEQLGIVIGLCTPLTITSMGTYGQSPEILGRQQQLVYNGGLMNLIWDILEHPLEAYMDAETKAERTEARLTGTGGLEMKNILLRNLFQTCYELLEMLCYENASMQQVVWSRHELYMSHMGIRGLNTADTVTAAVRGNRSIAESVKADTVQQFVNLISDHGRKARWLEFLMEFIVVDGEPIKRNQDLVLKIVLDDAEAVLSLNGNGDDTKGHRLDGQLALIRFNDDVARNVPGSEQNRLAKIMKNDHQRKMASPLVYHSMCLELLHRCAAGKAPATELRLKSMISWDDCISHILDITRTTRPEEAPTVDSEALCSIKAPFLRLLGEIYLNSDLQHVLEHKFARFWVPVENDMQGGCLFDEFINEINRFSDVIGAETLPQPRCQPYTQHQRGLRQRFIAACSLVKPGTVFSSLVRLSAEDQDCARDPASALLLLDANRDGTVSKDEWDAALKEAGVQLSTQDHDQIWDLIDGNASGTVDIDEIRLFIHGGPIAGQDEDVLFKHQKTYVLGAIVPCLYWFFSKYYRSTPIEGEEGTAFYHPASKEKVELLCKSLTRLLACQTLPVLSNHEQSSNMVKLVNLIQGNHKRVSGKAADSIKERATIGLVMVPETDYANGNIQKYMFMKEAKHDILQTEKERKRNAKEEVLAVNFLVYWENFVIALSKEILNESRMSQEDIRNATFYEVYETADILIKNDMKAADGDSGKHHAVIPHMVRLIDASDTLKDFRPSEELVVLTLRVLRAIVYFDTLETNHDKQRMSLLIDPSLEFEGEWKFEHELDDQSSPEEYAQQLQNIKPKQELFTVQQKKQAQHPKIVQMLVYHMAYSSGEILAEALHYAVALLQSDNGLLQVQGIFYDNLLSMTHTIQHDFVNRIQEGLRKGQIDLKFQLKAIKKKEKRKALLGSCSAERDRELTVLLTGKDPEEKALFFEQMVKTAILDANPHAQHWEAVFNQGKLNSLGDTTRSGVGRVLPPELPDLTIVCFALRTMRFEDRMNMAKFVTSIAVYHVFDRYVDAIPDDDKDKLFMVPFIDAIGKNMEENSAICGGRFTDALKKKLENCASSEYHVCESLRFLELLCAGEFRDFQDYLRCQPGDGANVDLISETFAFIDVVEDYIDKAISLNVQAPLEWIISGLETIEMSVRGPNETNVAHIELKSTALVSIVNTIFDAKLASDGSDLDATKAQVRKSMIQLLHSLLEADENGALAAKMSQGINWGLILQSVAHDFDILSSLGLSHDKPTNYTMKNMLTELPDMAGSGQSKARKVWSTHFEKEFKLGLHFTGVVDLLATTLQTKDLSEMDYDDIAIVKRCEDIEARMMDTYMFLLRVALEGDEAAEALKEWRDRYNTEHPIAYRLRSSTEKYMRKWVRRVEIIREGKSIPMAEFYCLNKQGAVFLNDSEWIKTRKEIFELEERAEQTMQTFLLRASRIDFMVNYRLSVRETARGLFKQSLELGNFIIGYLSLDVYSTLLLNLLLLLFYDPKLADRVPNDPPTDGPYEWFNPIRYAQYEHYVSGLGIADLGTQIGSEYCDSQVVGFLMLFLPLIHVMSYMFKLYFFIIMEAPEMCHELAQEAEAEKKEMEEEAERSGGAVEEDIDSDDDDSITHIIFSEAQKKLKQGFADVQSIGSTVTALVVDNMPIEDTDVFTQLSAENLMLISGAPEFQSLIFFCSCSIAGAFIHPLIFTVHLFDWILNDATVQLVLESVTLHIDKLWQTMVLLLIFDYAWAVLGYVFVWNWHADYTKTCGTLYQCFLTYFAEGLKSDGISDALRDTMSDDMYPRHIWDQPALMGVILWDFAYFVWVVLILVAIVTGVIIDTFGELRDADNENRERLHNECFVCGLEKDDLKSKDTAGGSKGFFDHVEEEHNIYAYMGYFMHLNEKYKLGKEMSSLQQYVHKCVFSGNRCVDFFPIGVAKRVMDDGDDEESSLKEDVLDLKEVLETMKQLGMSSA